MFETEFDWWNELQKDRVSYEAEKKSVADQVLERLETMRAVHIHVLSETPEEDAWKKMVAWAKPKGLLEKGNCVFGRNTYPTNAWL